VKDANGVVTEEALEVTAPVDSGLEDCPQTLAVRRAGGVALTAGIFPVVVENPAATEADVVQRDVYYTLQVTNPSDLKYSALKAGPNLEQARERHVGSFFFDDCSNGSLIVAGGAGPQGGACPADACPPLASVETSQVSAFGDPGEWRVPMRYDAGAPLGAAHVANALSEPRVGAAMVRARISRIPENGTEKDRVSREFLYVIGGMTQHPNSAETVNARGDVERAMVLGVRGMPQVINPKAELPPPGGAGLPFGSWYYRVSAVCPEGESLPSREVVANAAGIVNLSWAGVKCLDGSDPTYNVYRSPASDGRANHQRLLVREQAPTSFKDDGQGDKRFAPGRLHGTPTLNAGGTLAEGVWTYRVTAKVGDHETVAGYKTAVVVTAEDVTAGNLQISLRWDPVPGATYNVYRSAAAVTPGSALPDTFLLAEGLTENLLVDTGLAIDPSRAAPEGTSPLQPGDLGAWKPLPNVALNTPREAAQAAVVHVDDGGVPRAYLYVVGGRATTKATAEGTVERAEILLDGSLVKADGTPGFELLTESATLKPDLLQPRMYFGLVTTQGRESTLFPPPPPPPACPDFDGDGFEAAGCGGTDCDDSDPAVHPGAPERCNGRDDNCDGPLGDGTNSEPSETDADSDGFPVCGNDCNDANAGINPASPEVCGNDVDENCDGSAPACASVCQDADEDGASAYDPIACPTGTDCNDADPAVKPGLAEVCDDQKDNNCDDAADCADSACGQATNCQSKCVDNDADGYFAVDAECPSSNDCNDAAATINPGVVDICNNGVDENCDGRDRLCINRAPLPPKGPPERVFLIVANGSQDGTEALKGNLSPALAEAAEIVTVTSGEEKAGDLKPSATTAAWVKLTDKGGHAIGSSDTCMGFGFQLFDHSTDVAATLVWGGASGPGYGSATYKTGVYHFTPPATEDISAMLTQGSAASNLSPYFSRSYFSFVRVFGHLYGAGGVANGAPTNTTGYVPQ